MKLQNKGITLVSLVVTIVVLLIIATVTIRGIQGDGIIDRANEAKEKVGNLQIEEEIRFALLELQIKDETGAVTDKVEWLKSKLNAEVRVNEEGTLLILYKGYEIGVRSDYSSIQYIKVSD